MRGVFAAAAGFLLAVAAASGWVHPLPERRSTIIQPPLFEGASAPQDVTLLVGRACADCHSTRTQWPWYSRIAPISWLVESDVRRGREHMNLSEWDGYSDEEKRARLAAIATMVANRRMPPVSYQLAHSAARLTDMERTRISDWARLERHRLTK